MPSDHIYAKCNLTLSEESSSRCEFIVKVPGSTLDALRQNPLTHNPSNLKPFATEVGRDFLLSLRYAAGVRFGADCKLYPVDEVPAETQRPSWGHIGELTIWVIAWGAINQQGG